jgi:hypothetical protein
VVGGLGGWGVASVEGTVEAMGAAGSVVAGAGRVVEGGDVLTPAPEPQAPVAAASIIRPAARDRFIPAEYLGPAAPEPLSGWPARR